MIPKAEAIKSLDNDAQFSIQHLTDGDGNALDVITWDTTPINDEKIDTELSRLQAEYDAQEYARNRASDYPSTGDQLDMMYKDTKNSTTTHAAAVEAVKTKWPKDNSGPV